MGRDDGDRTRVERVDPLMGAVLDNRFRIEFRLAAGGFGAIYRATHVKSGHEVALKVLHTELATSDARVIARFRREGATLATLRDPHTITAYELGEAPTGELYIVMELLHGESLYEQFRAHGQLSWQRMVPIARMVCSSLAEAHALGIVHRDLKPANIHLEQREGNPDFVKVLDFGIAKIMRESDLDSTELTQAGQMIGTFDYMAPEQMIGGACTNVTDIYTLGIVMYEMIAGRRPFAEAQSPTSMLAALLTSSAAPLSSFVAVPPALDAIVMRCLEREPQSRFADVHELAAALDAVIAAGDEGVTKLISHTPPPQLHEEVTVIDTRREKALAQSRARRDSSQPPNAPVFVRREGSAPAVAPHVVRREGSGPVPVPRPSQPVLPPPTIESKPHPALIRRDGSAPYPTVASQPRIEAWAAPANDPRREDSQHAVDPYARHDGSKPLVNARLSQPAIQQQPPNNPPPRASEDPRGRRDSSQPLARPVIDPSAMQPYAVAPQRASQPVMGGWQPPQLPPQSQHAPAHLAQPQPPFAAPHLPPMGYDGPVRGSSLDVRAFDMSGAQSRDVVVRRVVWAIVIVVAGVLALVAASHL